MSTGSLIRDLLLLPVGTRVFVDIIIFDLAYRHKSQSCRHLVTRIAAGAIIAYVNYQVLSDLLHKLMLAEANTKGFISSRSASKLKRWLAADRTRAANLTDYQTQFENTLAIGLRVLRITKKTLVDTKHERANYALMTGDSLPLGTMNRHHPPLRDIVTYDSDFAHVPGVTLWTPMDVIS